MCCKYTAILKPFKYRLHLLLKQLHRSLKGNKQLPDLKKRTENMKTENRLKKHHRRPSRPAAGWVPALLLVFNGRIPPKVNLLKKGKKSGSWTFPQ